MAKKSVDSDKAAYASKGMKAPRPASYGKADPSAAPAHKPSMQHKEPSAQYSYPKSGEQSMAPSHKKSALPSKDAPEGASSVNGGSPQAMPKSGSVGESDV